MGLQRLDRDELTPNLLMSYPSAPLAAPTRALSIAAMDWAQLLTI